jgi:hypothetical protein
MITVDVQHTNYREEANGNLEIKNIISSIMNSSVCLNSGSEKESNQHEDIIIVTIQNKAKDN